MTTSFPPRQTFTIPLPRRAPLVLGERCLVMGILNITPDSFAGHAPMDAAAAVNAALQMEADGADIIDIGGESTRPGATPVSAAEELRRVVPVIRGLAGRLRVPLSIDTYKGEVARAALDAGASMVNDVSGLRCDGDLGAAVAAHGAALVLMHTRGGPANWHADATYTDLLGEVTIELRGAMARAVEAGVPVASLVFDPGIGFAKRPLHSYGVLAGLGRLGAALERPLLVGPSRKSFMRQALADRPAPNRDWGTAAAVTAAVLGGAHIVRVHAVNEMAQVIRVADEIRRHDEMAND
jgi:dihydropteroate synthase